MQKTVDWKNVIKMIYSEALFVVMECFRMKRAIVPFHSRLVRPYWSTVLSVSEGDVGGPGALPVV